MWLMLLPHITTIYSLVVIVSALEDEDEGESEDERDDGEQEAHQVGLLGYLLNGGLSHFFHGGVVDTLHVTDDFILHFYLTQFTRF